MKLHKLLLMIVAISSLFVFTQCERDELLLGDMSQEAADELLMKPADVGGDESVGNCLSFPVIWSDGATKVLRGTLGTAPVLDGEWYYVWGTDPIDPNDMDNLNSAGPYTDDNVTPPNDAYEPIYKAYVQKDENNVWQASNWYPGDDVPTVVDFIDWGDNLESVDWTLKSQVRTEVVLYETINPEVNTQYAMRHCFGWGSSEVHGLQTLDNDPVGVPSEHTEATGDLATVYTDNARLTIQKFFETDKGNIDNPNYNNIKWDADDHIWVNSGTKIINEEALFNMAVWQAEDGPGYYNAEVNVKGKLIYGYTWNLKRMNEGEGYYRITFSFDERDNLQTFFDSDITEIMEPVEEDPEDITSVVGEGDTGEPIKGAEAHMWKDNDTGLTLTYIDILITKQRRGGGRDGVGTGGNSGSGSGTGQGGSGSDSGTGSGSGGSGSGGSGSGGSGSGGSGHNGGGGH